jgi:hypothetical protein
VPASDEGEDGLARAGLGALGGAGREGFGGPFLLQELRFRPVAGTFLGDDASALGRTADSRRTAEAGDRRLSGDRREIHGGVASIRPRAIVAIPQVGGLHHRYERRAA